MSTTMRNAVVIAAALLVAGAGLGFAQTPTCTPGPATWTLTAGQTIDVGTVTVNNDATNLYVTYTLTYPNATFGTLHLWVGNDLTNVPAVSNGPNAGTPIPGQFPYQYTNDPDWTLTSYTFTVPLASLSITDVTGACPLTLYVVTHAEVDLDGDGGGDHETAFGGDLPGSGPRWWFYGAYCLLCDFDYQVTYSCETAFAKGGYVFVTDKKSNPEKLPSLNLTRNRWGWAINLTATGTTTYDIWAGAGLNKTANGTKVGTLTVNWDGAYATVTYALTAPFVMGEVHIYAGDSKPTTTAPGQYGNLAYFDPKTGTYSTTIPVSDTDGDGVWIIAHAVSCYPIDPVE